jgi:magnesium chelatase subunit H
MSAEERDNLVGKIYIKLMEIESRLLPCGLHVVGKPPSAEEAIATLVNIGSLDREEDGIKSLQRIIAESLGRDIDEIYANSDRGVLDDVQLLYDINQGVRAAVAALVHEQIDAEGRVSMVSKLNFFNIGRKEPWIKALHDAGYPKVDGEAIKPLMEYLEFCLEQVCADNELGGSVAGPGRGIRTARPRRRPHPQPGRAAHGQKYPRPRSPIYPHHGGGAVGQNGGGPAAGAPAPG